MPPAARPSQIHCRQHVEPGPFRLTHILGTYGYLAVLVFVMVESSGIPFPGETMLLVAAVYAGTTHQLSIGLVIAAAVGGAVSGDNLGFWVGREAGFRLLRRYGKHLHVNERQLKLGQCMFLRHGSKLVFFGRFVAVLRTWAAFLAGVNRMSWPRFLLANGLGAVAWATAYGLLGYFVGTAVHRLTGTIGLVLGAAVLAAMVGFALFLRKHQERWEDEALRALAGPLERAA